MAAGARAALDRRLTGIQSRPLLPRANQPIHNDANPPPPVTTLFCLQGALRALSDELDRDCFRDVVRAAAAAINRELFNGVATEAAFSAAGARQLAVDVAAVVRVFQVRLGGGRIGCCGGAGAFFSAPKSALHVRAYACNKHTNHTRQKTQPAALLLEKPRRLLPRNAGRARALELEGREPAGGGAAGAGGARARSVTHPG